MSNISHKVSKQGQAVKRAHLDTSRSSKITSLPTNPAPSRLSKCNKGGSNA